MKEKFATQERITKKNHLVKVHLFLFSIYKCFAYICVCVPHVCLLSAEA